MNASPSARGGSYTAYGLRIRSEIALPFLPAPPAAEPDVVIRVGAGPAALPAPAAAGPAPWQAAPGAFLLDVDGVARYHVRDGREIVVEPAGSGGDALSTFLLGSVLGACLQQRGILTLHASAIETDAGAVLFAGASGSGKSTLLAALLERGYAMLADDVTGVVFDAGGRPTALSAFPAVRLWDDALEALVWPAGSAGRVRKELDKRVVPVDRFCRAPLGVRAVFTLASHNRDAIEIEPAPPALAFGALLRHTYRKRYLAGAGRQPEHFRAVAALSRHAPLWQVTRPMHPYLLSALADEVEDRLRADPPAHAAPARRPARPEDDDPA